MTPRKYPPTLTTQEFRDRIRQLCGITEGAGRHAHHCLVRQPGDRGYRATQTQPTRKEDNEQLQSNSRTHG
jgi:hypothetical protein